ncbi:MAG: zinc ribbon domain-containing protein [Thermodesulfobacteriota bacterium]|nr:zinc ribbon domain-containing protein [Thermodesulfobacteriota bacterium]
MPIFEYHCLRCQDDFEKIVFTAKAEVKCPRCQSKKVNKKISAFSFKSGSKFVPASNSGGCGSCSSHHCSTCH